jgi:hypothetical protein
MGVEDRDWYRETQQQQQQHRSNLWLLGALVLVVTLFVGSPAGHRLLHMPGTRFSGERVFHPEGVVVTPLPGAPGVALHRAPLYAPGDPWRSYLADERVCPGGERTDLSAQQQVEVMLCLIDWAQRKAGLSEPMPTALLTSTAVQKGQEIVRCQNFAHAACGDDPAADVRRADYHGSWGENLYIADGRFGAPRVALDAWLNSPGHRQNLFRAEWRAQRDSRS